MKQVLDLIRSKRTPSYTKQTDIKRIVKAKETGNWEEVYKSSLYRIHGGEYCELLSVMHRFESEGGVYHR